MEDRALLITACLISFSNLAHSIATRIIIKEKLKKWKQSADNDASAD